MKTEKGCCSGVNGFADQIGKRGEEMEAVLLKTQESEEAQVMGHKVAFGDISGYVNNPLEKQTLMMQERKVTIKIQENR